MMMTAIHTIGAAARPAAAALLYPGRRPRGRAAGRSGLCSVGGTLTRSAQGAFPIEETLMLQLLQPSLDPSFRELNRRQALARETKPECSRVGRTVTGGRDIDSTHYLDR